MNRKRRLILTCTLCSNFDPNRSICRINSEVRDPISDQYAPTCKRKGDFVRYMNVLPDAYNYFSADEEIPNDFQIDLSKLPKDNDEIPLFVHTNRGIERAIPANESVTLKGHAAFGVELIYTLQGQQQLIYEIGIEKAREEANNAGVELTKIHEY
ncbi:hypothetical protein [Oceanobacillus salinisoli]|uniref:hypothetical protein n=1 Tax=Oceanobacillus salinisoli TaxID=2678611 RepID=UPI0012E2765B|nr:hypothetical protein [Oceanobacillus salinisoli]